MNNWKKRLLKILFDISLIILAYFFAFEMSHNSIFSEKPYPYINISGGASENAEDYEQLKEVLEPYSVSPVLSIKSWNESGAVISLVGTEKGLGSYTKWTGIEAGHYGSLIGTDYEVKKYAWTDIPEIPVGAETLIYFVSEGNAKRDLPAEVILGLGVSDLSGWKVDLRSISDGWFWKIFAAVTVLMLLFEGYQALYEIKGYVLQLLFGRNIGGIIFKKLLTDFLVVGSAYAGCCLIAARIFDEPVPGSILLISFCAFLLGDLLINLLAFAKSWKQTLVRVQESGKLAAVSHVIRIVMLTALIVLCNLNVSCYDVYEKATTHDAFYDYFSGYGVLEDSYDDADFLYLELLKNNRAALLYHSTDYQGTPVIYVNQTTFGFLEQTNSSFSFEESMNEHIVIYYPESMEEPSELAERVIAHPSESGEDIRFASYQGKVDLPLQRGTAYNPELLTWADQPVIIADFRSNLDFFAESLSAEICYVWLESYLVRFEDEHAERAEYVSETGTVYALRNVNKIFEASVYPYLLVVRYVTVLLLLMGVMEIILSVRIIFLEFQMNTTKYISKRLLGAGFTETYAGFFMTTLILCVMGGICSRMIIRENFSGKLCLMVCLVTGAVEIFIQVVYVLKLEKANFPKLLKGGIL